MSFEKPGRALPQGWSQTTSFPHESEVLRYFHDGKTVLHYQSKGKAHPSLQLSKAFQRRHGLRLSYYQNKGAMRVRITDNKKKLLSEVLMAPVSEKATKAVGDTSRKAKITAAIPAAIRLHHCHVRQTWRSCVLEFDKKLTKAWPKELRVSFSPVGAHVDWHLDRVQSVRKAEGIALSSLAFDQFFPGFGSIFITFAAFLFAFSTMITWSYYGETGITYAIGRRGVMPYRIVFLTLAFVGAVQKLGIVISFSDIMIGLLVIPNMIAMLLLSGKVSEMSKDYFAKLKSGEIKPVSKHSASKS